MKYELVVAPAAQQDIEEAFSYYLNIRYALAERFIAKVQDVYTKLMDKPHRYSYFGSLETIRAVSSSFPYLVVFQMKNDTVFVIGLHNTHQTRKRS